MLENLEKTKPIMKRKWSNKNPSSLIPHRSSLTRIIRTLRREIRKFKTTTLEQIAQERDPFKVLISCILSLQTRDPVTEQASAWLYAVAQTPQGLLAIPQARIRKLIYPVSFYNIKAGVIHGVCRDIIHRFGGRVPATIEELTSMKGVGRKTANIVITLGHRKPGIAVDTHVHRISNRIGLVKTKTPEKTEFALRELLPKRYWIDYNDLLVTWGQNICTPLSPKCSICAIAKWCQRVGVTRSR